MKLHSHRWIACVVALVGLGASAWAPPASAQNVALDPKARYDRDIALCNGSGLPAPAREACVRQAGLVLDSVTGGIAGSRETISPDGRATVIEPLVGTPGATGLPRRGATAPAPLVTTPDGRATVVNPAAQ